MPQKIDIPALLKHADKIAAEVEKWPERKRHLNYSQRSLEQPSKPEARSDQAKKTPPAPTGD